MFRSDGKLPIKPISIKLKRDFSYNYKKRYKTQVQEFSVGESGKQ